MNLGDLGVLVETHSGHLRFLKPVLESMRSLRPAILTCSYNTVLDTSKNYTTQEVLPPYDVMAIPDMWMIAEFGQRVNSWLWLEKFGLALLTKGFKDTPPPKYIFSIEGDCIITKPKGIHDLENAMIADGTDIITAEYVENSVAGAVSYLAKTEAIVKIIDLMVKEAYERDDPNGQQYGNIEGRFAKAIKQLGYKCSAINNPEHSQFSFGYRGTWGDILGFRHLHGMEKWRQSRHHPPLPKAWYDTRYIGNELTVLEEYWATGNEEILTTKGYWQPASQEFLNEGLRYRENP